MSKVRTFLDNLEENVLLFILFAAVVLIFMQVVMRYVFSNSISWSEELGRYLFIWLTWLSTGYAVRKKRHLRIEVIMDFFGERGKTIIDIITMIVWSGFTVFLINQSWQVTSMVWRRGQLSAALEIYTAFAYAAIPVGATIMLLRLIDEIVRSVRKLGSQPQGGEAK